MWTERRTSCVDLMSKTPKRRVVQLSSEIASKSFRVALLHHHFPPSVAAVLSTNQVYTKLCSRRLETESIPWKCHIVEFSTRFEGGDTHRLLQCGCREAGCWLLSSGSPAGFLDAPPSHTAPCPLLANRTEGNKHKHTHTHTVNSLGLSLSSLALASEMLKQGWAM